MLRTYFIKQNKMEVTYTDAITGLDFVATIKNQDIGGVDTTVDFVFNRYIVGTKYHSYKIVGCHQGFLLLLIFAPPDTTIPTVYPIWLMQPESRCYTPPDFDEEAAAAEEMAVAMENAIVATDATFNSKLVEQIYDVSE